MMQLIWDGKVLHHATSKSSLLAPMVPPLPQMLEFGDHKAICDVVVHKWDCWLPRRSTRARRAADADRAVLTRDTQENYLSLCGFESPQHGTYVIPSESGELLAALDVCSAASWQQLICAAPYVNPACAPGVAEQAFRELCASLLHTFKKRRLKMISDHRDPHAHRAFSTSNSLSQRVACLTAMPHGHWPEADQMLLVQRPIKVPFEFLPWHSGVVHWS